MSSSSRLWRVSSVLLAPKAARPAPDGGLPQKLEFESRIPEQGRQYENMTVAIRKLGGECAEHMAADPQVEGLELVAEVEAGDDAASAVEAVGPFIENIVDLLMFSMGTALALGQVHVLDVTPPLNVGEHRASVTYAQAPFDRHARSVEMQAIQGALIGHLPPVNSIGESKLAAVLRWFAKSLGTNVLHDQFIFLWIALEILVDRSDVRVEEPYVGSCGHQIVHCPDPDCRAETTRMVRGATMRAYLEQSGVEPEQAKELWRMRQIMHGAIPFDSGKLAKLGALVQPLRAVVAAGLKDALGLQPADPPIVQFSGLSIHPAMALSGTSVIGDDDIRPLG